ncbi:sensor histidine kinase [Paenibacillus faecis]|uniref:HAMP domain-containing histidine kinase n=1 Tax=Paenibacillus faecis TaxID=862114 RepID=UPI001B25F919|nr:HAMP domain-containing histidine kinase [Paenibacillus faecis]GIO83410.1 sensor histidine kinase [Paenibacillus faecis]
MKLFLKDHRALVAVYALQLLAVSGVYWLDGYRDGYVVLYAGLLSGCLLAGYLLIRFLTHRSFYACLEQDGAMDAFKEVEPRTPLSESLYRLLKKQYRAYVTEINAQQYKITRHLQFISQWVHQMKTPVSVIHLLVQDSDDARFVAVGDEVDRLRKGLDLVLYTTRLDGFAQDFMVEKLELEALVRSVVSEQKRLFIRSKVFPRMQFPSGERLFIATDEKWLSFALTQVLTNAVRYTTKENANLTLRAYRRDEETVLEISDEGVGIPASDLPRVFEAYFTGENGRNFRESTGMGLYLVKQICDQLGHRVEIESAVMEGTTIRIRFGGRRTETLQGSKEV